jgi:hypothetical protein
MKSPAPFQVSGFGLFFDSASPFSPSNHRERESIFPRTGMPRATRVQVNALSLLYLLDVDKLICIQAIPLERRLT